MDENDKKKIAEILEKSRRLERDSKRALTICMLFAIANLLESYQMSKIYNLFFGTRNLIDIIIDMLHNLIG